MIILAFQRERLALCRGMGDIKSRIAGNRLYEYPLFSILSFLFNTAWLGLLALAGFPLLLRVFAAIED